MIITYYGLILVLFEPKVEPKKGNFNHSTQSHNENNLLFCISMSNSNTAQHRHVNSVKEVVMLWFTLVTCGDEEKVTLHE